MAPGYRLVLALLTVSQIPFQWEEGICGEQDGDVLGPVELQRPGELWSSSGRRDGGFRAIRRHQLLPVVADERQAWAAMALGGRSLAPVLLRGLCLVRLSGAGLWITI